MDDCLILYRNNSSTDRIVRAFATRILKSTEDSLLIVDNSDGDLYARVRKELKAKGYNIHIINIKDPEKSEQYGLLIDLFSLIDKAKVDVYKFAWDAMCMIMDNTKNSYDNQITPVDVGNKLLMYYENGNVNIMNFLDELIKNPEVFKKMHERCGMMLSGYDFYLEEPVKKAIFVIPPEKENIDNGIVGLFLLPLILYLFPIVTGRAGRAYIFNVEDLGVIKGPILQDYLNSSAKYPFHFTVGGYGNRMIDSEMPGTGKTFFTKLENNDAENVLL